jgi:phosphoribosylcarboxyaminoimidazole (NCAIR) mutase
MPPGIPVGSMAIGKAGATNAAVFAAQILAVADEALAKTLSEFKVQQAEKVAKKDQDLQSRS